jgi:hypothetical protein
MTLTNERHFLWGGAMDPSTFEVVDRFLRNPPAILLMIVVALVVAHVLKMILERADSWAGRAGDVVIAVVEISITLVIAAVTLKAYVFDSLVPAEHSASWYQLPYVLLITLAVFGLASMIVYLHFKRLK